MSSTAIQNAVVFPSRLFHECLPDRMATIAALSGATPPAIDGATVVDIGCATAANLLAIAAARPSVTTIGIDPDGQAIAQGQHFVNDAGLTNATLVQDTRVPLDDGQADFVIAHGVLSWVSDEARAEVIAEAARVTRRGGLVLLSYNVSPGTLQRHVTRSLARRAARAQIKAGDAPAAFDAVLARLREVAAYAEEDPEYARFVSEEADRIALVGPDVLFHDELHEHWYPLAVSAVASQATHNGLSYIGELEPGDRWRERLPQQEVRKIVNSTAASAVDRQQLVDDILGTTFHASLFLRGAAPRAPIGGGARRPAGPRSEQWYVWSHHTADWPSFPDTKQTAAAEAIRAAGAEGLSIAALAALIRVAPDAARQIASTFDAYGLAVLSIERPPAAAEPGVRPRASTLAQAELRSGLEKVSSLRHRQVTIDNPHLRELVLLLDGTRDRAALIAALEASPDLEPASTAAFVERLDTTLSVLADAGLLSP